MLPKQQAPFVTPLFRQYAHFEGDNAPPPPPDPATPPANNGGSNGEGDSPAWLPARLQRAADAERKRLLAELGIDDPTVAKQLIADAQKRQQDDMTEAQKAQARVAELQPKAKRLEAVEAALQATVEKRVEQLPKAMRGLVPDFDDPLKTLKWLDDNAAALSLPIMPNLNAGQQGDPGKKPMELTPEQKALAKKLHIPEDKYAAQLRKEQDKQRS